MKTIGTYIAEKLHLAKDMKKVYYVVILKYLSKPKVQYETCTTPEDVVEQIRKYHSFNNVYKMYDLSKLDDLFKSLWDPIGDVKRNELLKKWDIECCTDEIRELLRNTPKNK